MTPAIELRNIRYTFKGNPQPTLNGIDLKIGPNESLGLIGHNGSGKSTLLRVISTLLAPQTGEVFFHGRPASEVFRQIRPLISFSAGAPLGFYPRLSGIENLQLFASFKGGHLSKQDGRLLMERVGLQSAKDQIYFRYSLGMRQRLHLARLCLKPFEFVFVDEPSNGLDPAGLELLVDLFDNELSQSTRLVISHDRAILSRLTQKCMELKAGHLHAL